MWLRRVQTCRQRVVCLLWRCLLLATFFVYLTTIAMHEPRIVSPLAREVSDSSFSGLPQEDPGLVEYVRELIDSPSTLPYNLTEPHKLHFSQFGQSKFASTILGRMRGGFFIEAGAANGEYLSNSLYLEKSMGWSGLLVEAVPGSYSQLLQKHRHAHTLQAALATSKHAGWVAIKPKGNHGVLSSVVELKSGFNGNTNNNNKQTERLKEVPGRTYDNGREDMGETNRDTMLIEEREANKDTTITENGGKNRRETARDSNRWTEVSEGGRHETNANKEKDVRDRRGDGRDREKGVIDRNKDGNKALRLKGRGESITVRSIPLFTVLLALNITTIDFFSLDTEGNDLKILQTLPLDHIRIRLLCVECNKERWVERALYRYLTPLGYLFLGRRSIDCWFGWPDLLNQNVLANYSNKLS